MKILQYLLITPYFIQGLGILGRQLALVEAPGLFAF